MRTDSKMSIIYNAFKERARLGKKVTFKEVSYRTRLPVHLVSVYGNLLRKAGMLKYAGSARYKGRILKTWIMDSNKQEEAKGANVNKRLAVVLKKLVEVSNELVLLTRDLK
jgi:hypothetical protein